MLNQTVDIFKTFGLPTPQDKVEQEISKLSKPFKQGRRWIERKEAASKWTGYMDSDNVFKVQEDCKEAMKLWGYINVESEEDLHSGKDFYEKTAFHDFDPS